jgi:hypothetical protein
VVGTLKVKFFGRAANGRGNWCWDVVTIQRVDLVRILNYLQKQDGWNFDFAELKLFEKWQNKEPITEQDLI